MSEVAETMRRYQMLKKWLFDDDQAPDDQKFPAAIRKFFCDELDSLEQIIDGWWRDDYLHRSKD